MNDFVRQFAASCGMISTPPASGSRKIQNAVWRDRSSNDRPFFGAIKPSEDLRGAYSDMSLIFFPHPEKKNVALMTIDVGSIGFKDDFVLADSPGMRRLFMKLLPSNPGYTTYAQASFLDIENQVTCFDDFSLGSYDRGILIACVVDFSYDDCKTIIKAWIAQYADIRHWATNAAQRDIIKDAIYAGRKLCASNSPDDFSEIERLVEKRHYVVLEGAPGVGKTHLATQISKQYSPDNIFFTQFHANTSYADFVDGIKPVIGNDSLIFTNVDGTLSQAMKRATEVAKKNEKVLLFIDEINRANLANVLGPVFYLFEPKRTLAPDFKIIVGGQEYSSLPDNLRVIATMNTSDRSLAIVDIALRRRFAWYKIKPHWFGAQDTIGYEEFERMARIYELHASDQELDLQPGASYFMAENPDELVERIKYELKPLIKDYINRGYMRKAVSDLDNFFYDTIHEHLID